ncbi:adenylate/guanylate cyclase domain-containing protein [Rhodococcus tukisamuensis]|uniref:Adenylate cyclase, class 3 n=1 Tax=Rhodococcus tukisamuensis TaxID=168276 RepID=A0A1G6M054_9NOCA|nr:adenylate/guanylate cyclase domain-containing protein [Rhodococcus tukisamuensis]SDC48747.1 Adenylate cyclase, class 3 [Rhodococcus tukisamuensis]
MDPPEIQYVDREGSALAYQVVGDGDLDVVWFFEFNLHLDLMWTDPHVHYLMERGSTFARTTYFQRRGLGLSDPVDRVPTLDEQVSDLLAVMDEVGIQRATLVGMASTCAAVSVLAARAPERVTGLVLVQPLGESLLDTDRPPFGWDPEEVERFVTGWRAAAETWGSGNSTGIWDPAVDSPYNRRLMALLERCSAPPSTARTHLEWTFRLDFTQVLPSIQCPTRVLLVPDSPVPRRSARHVADLIPHGRFHLLPPAPPGASLGEAWTPVLDHVEEIATGVHRPTDADRFLAAVLFTDIVGSTEVLARIGDSKYTALLAAHEREVRDEVEQGGGRVVKVTGDGTFSTFDGPVAAVRCAHRICGGAGSLGIEVRAGVHVGPVERAGPEITGMTVHAGARIGAAAGPGEVLVSRAVRDLVAGSGLSFVDRDLHELKGVPGRWSLYALDDTILPTPLLERNHPSPNMFDRSVLRLARRAPRLLRTVATVANAAQRRTSRRRGTATNLD